MLTQERLKQVLRYDPVTGFFFWRIIPNRRIKIGARAGTIHREGYKVIKIDGILYQASRLAYLYVEGKWPENFIDHENEYKLGNSYNNLRPATASQNQHNRRKANANSQTGLQGIYKLGKKFQAQIRVNKKLITIGTFSDINDAVAARKSAKMKYHKFCT